MKQVSMKILGQVPQMVLGCMRIEGINNNERRHLLETALELGINYFDHADIYGAGNCERLFSQAMKEIGVSRDRVILQSKCGIRSGFFDFSKVHILASVDGILERLQTDYLDVLLLHRPDTLMEPEEVADAFRVLKSSGKVRAFGVSNQTPMQMELLTRYVKEPLIANQLQFSVTNTGMIDEGLCANMQNDAAVNRDGEVLEYCRLHDITIQAWSPLQYSYFGGVFIGSEKYPELNRVLEEMGEKYGVSKTAMAIAWIMRHPAGIQPVLGTMNVERLKEISKAADVTLSREDWYKIYLSAGNILP